MTFAVFFTKHANKGLPLIFRRHGVRAMLLCLAMLCYSMDLIAITQTTTLGWLEWAWLKPGDIKIKTKLDTGAKTSSIDATEIETFERQGKTWVRFTIPLSERPEDSDLKADVAFERPVVRVIKIKDHENAASTRYVVNMSLCVGGKVMKTPVSLANRKNFNYPLLLGRTALKNGILVNSSKTFTASHSCRPAQ